jgi:hypothetical protein
VAISPPLHTVRSGSCARAVLAPGDLRALADVDGYPHTHVGSNLSCRGRAHAGAQMPTHEGTSCQEGVVTPESTSDYWRIWFYLLEAAGLEVQLVNARDIKNAPGRPEGRKCR